MEYMFEVEPAKAELVVTGNTISVDNATDKITIDDTVSNPTNGTITVAYGSTASAGGIEGALQDGTPITIKNETLPVGDIHNADGAVLTLDGVTIPAKDGGTANITGEVVSVGDTTAEGMTYISHLTVSAGSTFNIETDLLADVVIMKSGATLRFDVGGGQHMVFVASKDCVINFNDGVIYDNLDDLTGGISFTKDDRWYGNDGAILKAAQGGCGDVSIS